MSNIELPERQPTLRVVPMPADVNAAGDIFGGWVMAQVDIAGGVAATLAAGGRIATVAVNAFQFRQPISVGDVVSFYASVSRVGKTSVTIDVQVYAQRFIENQRELLVVKVTEATLTYVGVNHDGSKREIGTPVV
ncbi:MAG: acyl-CoA thioesterase [Sterolibacterium sp.]|nr:acyl-CoA thioesterase [Sterolibacterium sp.]